MSNPFDAPSTQPAAGGPPTMGRGDVDVGVTIQDAVDALKRNALPAMGVIVVANIALFISYMLCILPVFVVGPAISWGVYRFTLDALDGEAEFGTLFQGFDKLGDILLPMLGFLFLQGLALFVGAIPYVFAVLVGMLTESDVLMLLLGGIGYILLIVWSFAVQLKLMPGLFLIIEQGMGTMDAIKESIAITSGQTVPLLLVMLTAFAASLVGTLACFVGIIPAMFFIFAMYGSAYRQMIGARSAA